MMPELHHCRRCGTSKARDQFYASTRAKSGLQTYCKDCCRAIRKPHVWLHPERRDETDAGRFQRHIRQAGDCHLWTGYLNSDGYGRFRAGGRMLSAHRFAYESAKGPVPDGYEIDHLCRTRHCVNPEHMEAVPHPENMRRGLRGELTTHCKQGHAYDVANTIRRGNKRSCRRCSNAASRRYQARRRAEGWR
jgi:hypothetical protein